MFRRPRTSPLLLLLAVPVLAVFSAGCSGIASPEGYASPVLSDGLLLVAHRDELFALDAQTLQSKWLFPSGDIDDGDVVALYGTPVVGDGVVYVPTYDGTLYALDLEDGTPVWPEPFEADSPLAGGAAFANGTVFFGSSNGTVYGVDAESGQEAWPAFKTGDQVWSTPVVEGGDLYVTSLDGNLYVLDPASGEELWSFQTGAGVASTPVVDEVGGQVFVGGFDQLLQAIDIETHEKVWSIEAKNWFWTTPLFEGGTVYAPSLDKKVYAVGAGTGEEAWDAFGASAAIKSAPVAVGDTLFVVDGDGLVYGIDRQSGEEAFSDPLDVASAVLSDPLVLEQDGSMVIAIVTMSGDLVLIDPETLQTVRAIELSG